jgi:hypothetical protein
MESRDETHRKENHEGEQNNKEGKSFAPQQRKSPAPK